MAGYTLSSFNGFLYPLGEKLFPPDYVQSDAVLVEQVTETTQYKLEEK
jgi:hypothetical protein